MTTDYSTLFEQTHIGTIPFSNRYIVAPMTRVTANNDGTANDTMKKYYERYAKGGFSGIISEGIYIDDAHSQGYDNQPGLVTEQHKHAWKKIVDQVHEYDTKMVAQLMHAGGQVQGNAYTDETIAPSAVAPKGEQLGFYGGSGPFPTPNTMTKEDIDQVIASFADAAALAKEAGFDGVEIHGANGYLLDEFLTDYMNQRTDEYGGSIEAGLKIILEIITAIREKVGEDYMVGIRLSQGKVSDQSYRWPNSEHDAKMIFGTLGNEALDYIHVTDGDGTAPGFGDNTRSMAQAASEFGGKPVIANGKLGDPDQALKAVIEEKADFVSLGTGALANPDTPHRVENGNKLKDFDAESILFPIAHIKDLELNVEIK
ncbi:NADH:flavin oxidoreductase [Pontibacillus yanchengensis]|uniref:NADH:flavin oxidoreductase n=2 Tax=Pontibacillus yanchengensis TaxID=462910 RepID=A0ACC7VDT4_9BACI|nr:NADH:flavin oxidoreductase [Pontibacillus yanchengensis]MYL32272.1 NADH:flavin oxidoreductase [Pontibacillus yanchengensis]MYL52852.1 NADH:flavin oxidoreductase [Pontibacillus yanchengensis]